MILFAIGDEHTAAAMAVNNCTFAEEDAKHGLLGKKPHPDNLHISWANKLAYALKMTLATVKPAKTNAQIIQSTNDWLESVSNRYSPEDVFIVIGWNSLTYDESLTDIRNYHIYLEYIGINHLFFDTEHKLEFDYDFKNAYVDTGYIEYIKSKGIIPVITSGLYYGADAHTEWAKYLLLHIAKNDIV